MEKIATDTYSFKDIREGGFVYVDKMMRNLCDRQIELAADC